ncbi:hypothetical protein BBJ29_004341 [Phytophthora kernoviae]|uniref:Uncharacterized protein n=1 Tax=Phytophthora kernoviae TaxID=325452 RepID=A0A3F2RWY0_9STRA|nr:hypothetical protein BBJ29_004341 [Phytophthora kernoviae]RLN65867.1 hypothetical protein BBP00_00002590 [Phytophthora kernoviae]
MREEKLRTALDFAMALSPDNTLFSENKFENAQGDMCCVRYETVQFNGVSSLQEVFDAVSFYKTNMEFIISEQLGHTTLRDDYDAVVKTMMDTTEIHVLL